MEGERTNRCIYNQKSSTQHTEKEMVRVVTLLAKYMDMLGVVVAAVRDHKRACDAECSLEQFTLFNLARNTIMELMDAIAVWQQGFTKVLRPVLLECDYMVKLIKGADFFNGTLLRRIYNFSFGKKNILFLPMPNPKTIAPNLVSPALAEQIRLFAAPPVERVVACYQVLINSLPKKIFSKILPIEEWLRNRWVPKIEYGPSVELPPVVNTKKSVSSTGNSRESKLMESLKIKKEMSMRKSLIAKMSADKSSAIVVGPGAGPVSGEELGKSQEQETVQLVKVDHLMDADWAVSEEDELMRLSRLFIPKEKIAMLEAFDDLAAELSQSVVESSTGLLPPHTDSLEGPVLASGLLEPSVVSSSVGDENKDAQSVGSLAGASAVESVKPTPLSLPLQPALDAHASQVEPPAAPVINIDHVGDWKGGGGGASKGVAVAAVSPMRKPTSPEGPKRVSMSMSGPPAAALLRNRTQSLSQSKSHQDGRLSPVLSPTAPGLTGGAGVSLPSGSGRLSVEERAARMKVKTGTIRQDFFNKQGKMNTDREGEEDDETLES